VREHEACQQMLKEKTSRLLSSKLARMIEIDRELLLSLRLLWECQFWRELAAERLRDQDWSTSHICNGSAVPKKS